MHMQFQKRLLRLEFNALPDKQRIGSFLHVSDRSALDALVYTKRYGSSNDDVAEFQSLPEFQSCVELCQDANNSLVVLFPVIQELLKLDGTRMLGTLEEEQRFHQLFESTLQDLNVPYYVLGRNLETRGSDLLSRVHTKINTSMSEEEDQQHQQ